MEEFMSYAVTFLSVSLLSLWFALWPRVVYTMYIHCVRTSVCSLPMGPKSFAGSSVIRSTRRRCVGRSTALVCAPTARAATLSTPLTRCWVPRLRIRCPWPPPANSSRSLLRAIQPRVCRSLPPAVRRPCPCASRCRHPSIRCVRLSKIGKVQSGRAQGWCCGDVQSLDVCTSLLFSGFHFLPCAFFVGNLPHILSMFLHLPACAGDHADGKLSIWSCHGVC